MLCFSFKFFIGIHAHRVNTIYIYSVYRIRQHLYTLYSDLMSFLSYMCIIFAFTYIILYCIICWINKTYFKSERYGTYSNCFKSPSLTLIGCVRWHLLLQPASKPLKPMTKVLPPSVSSIGFSCERQWSRTFAGHIISQLLLVNILINITFNFYHVLNYQQFFSSPALKWWDSTETKMKHERARLLKGKLLTASTKQHNILMGKC